MGIFKRTGSRIGSAFYSGLALDVFTNMFGFLKQLFYSVFMPWKLGEPGKPETFEQAIKRMGLTEADLEKRKKMFTTQVILYIVMSFLVLIYAIHLASTHEVTGMFMAILVSVLGLAYAFRSHFWLFQLKQRRLGCTFKEWLSSTIQG